MPDYHEMYATLFKSVTDAIEKLQNAQQQTEEMYISADVPNIKMLPKE